MVLQVESPLKIRVWPGAILASIAHAIFVARAPIMSHTQSWDGRNYNVQNGEGSRGTIAFAESHEEFVGVFYLEESKRNPLRSGSPERFDPKQLLRGLPAALEPVARQALRYVVQNVGGTKKPIITASFWSDPASEHLVAAEPWNDAMKNGAILVGVQLSDAAEAIGKWREEYELTIPEMDLLQSLSTRRIAAPSGSLHLLPQEKNLLVSTADDEEGIEACRECFREIDIFF